MGPWIRDPILGQFWKLGFFSVRECEIFAHRGKIFKFLDHEHVASIPTWNLPKKTCMTHRNPIFIHGFHSIPQARIEKVSLKAYRRWDSTYHRMMTVAQIDELSALLDSVHRDNSRVVLYSGSMEKGSLFLSILETRVLLSK